MENTLVAWSRDTAGTYEIDRARATLQALIVRLGELVPAGTGTTGVPDGVVALLLELRGAARADSDYALGDRIRDALVAEGIELHDDAAGTTWKQRPD